MPARAVPASRPDQDVGAIERWNGIVDSGIWIGRFSSLRSTRRVSASGVPARSARQDRGTLERRIRPPSR